MPDKLEETKLRRAIETTLIQMCRIGLSFEREISVEGTIGVSVDKETVLLIHFDDYFIADTSKDMHDDCSPKQMCHDDTASQHDALSVDENCTQKYIPAAANTQITMDASVYMTSPMPTTSISSDITTTVESTNLFSAPIDRVTSDMSSAAQVHTPAQSHSCDMRLLGAEALFSLLNKPTVIDMGKDTGSKDNLSDQTDLPGKMSYDFSEAVAINIDSDSESFGSLQFEDYDNDKSKVFDSNMEDKNLDRKNIIVIDDNSDLLRPGSNDPTLSFHAEHLSCSLSSPTSTTALSHYPSTSLPSYGIAKKSIKVPSLNPNRPQSSDDETERTPVTKKSRSNGKTKVHTCEVCGREFMNLGLLETHLVGAHGVTETSTLGKITHFECTVCKKKFRYQATLDKHVIRHNNRGSDKQHRCDVCRSGYRYRESLDIHVQIHSGENVFRCRVCDKEYANKLLFQKHIIYMHEIRKGHEPRWTAQKKSKCGKSNDKKSQIQ